MKLLRKHVFHLSDIPGDLDSVITIDGKSEVNPREVGLLQSDVDHIWDNIIKIYKTGVHPAITACIRHQGKVLLSRAIGHARGNGPNDGPGSEKVLATPDTPMCLYSTSKGITALLMHMLQEDGLINVSDPVSFYAPEFARKGKENITIHQILAHRGGIPGLPKDVAIEVLWDEDQTWELLCDAEPIMTDGSKLAYHAITGGFVLERVIRKVTGANINAYITKKIREPMGMKYFSYGVEPQYRDDLAVTYATGPRPGPLLGAFIKRALGTDMASLEETCNDPRFQEAIIPAGNLAGTAEETCRFFQMMLNGGKYGRRRICAHSTVARAVQEFGSRTIDRTLFLPMRYSAGLMLGDEPFGIWGPNSRHAFGHAGLINKFAWADPQRDMAVSILTSGLPLIAHHIRPLLDTIRSICNTFPIKDANPEPFALQLG
ncbi:MAG: beta-lactamase family protein [Gammaproteobacteria bacterium]|jgi:CubicO group peptidase (beta-lactamase class C family)|nr:beta-lactamase family protein [Gammaproteobacteria bacterium]MDH5171833.1 beta-lactamase family protein [Gammaproteobacteria bacterium]